MPAYLYRMERYPTHRTGNIIQVVGKPSLKSTSLKSVCHRIPINGSSDKHHSTGKDCREAYSHFIEIIPAKMRKNTNTLRKCLRTCIVPNAVESQPRVDCIRSLIGESMSIKIYEQNIANAKSSNTNQRIPAESRSVW